MSKITCAAIDCKHNGKGYHCQLNKITLSESYTHTVYDGVQHFWKCKQYEKDPEIEKMEESFKRFVEGGGDYGNNSREL